MSNIQTGAERMPHDLSHLGFLAGQIGRLITISTTPVIAGDSFEMYAVGALRLSPLRRGLRFYSTVDTCTFFVTVLTFYYSLKCFGYRWRLLRDGRRWRSSFFSIASWPCYCLYCRHFYFLCLSSSRLWCTMDYVYDGWCY